MKKQVSVAAVEVVELVSDVNAADVEIARRDIPPPPAPIYNWGAGPYFGFQFGYGWGRHQSGEISLFDDPSAPPALTIPGVRADTRGTLIGGLAGYNFQFGPW